MSAGAQNSAAQQQKNNFRVNLDRCTNFMRQFRDPESRELTKLSANQFMDVWSHYDKDGNLWPPHTLSSISSNEYVYIAPHPTPLSSYMYVPVLYLLHSSTP